MTMPLMQAPSAVHVGLYRLTGGRVGGRFVGKTRILLLTTVGRRSGKRRTRPLAYVRDSEDYVLCASNNGASKHPGWYLNASASGTAEIQVGSQKLRVTTRTADPDERSRLYPLFVEMYEGYAAYERKTDRQIPLLVLTHERAA
jgi:deazaflavin-dependent oxidoreductase (nitroreductase family)